MSAGGSELGSVLLFVQDTLTRPGESVTVAPMYRAPVLEVTSYEFDRLMEAVTCDRIRPCVARTSALGQCSRHQELASLLFEVEDNSEQAQYRALVKAAAQPSWPSGLLEAAHFAIDAQDYKRLREVLASVL